MRTIIEINGRQYDTKTGEIVKDVKKTKKQIDVLTQPDMKIDDQEKAKKSQTVHRDKPFISDINNATIFQFNSPRHTGLSRPKPNSNINIIVKTQKSKTLLRQIVKKPTKTPNIIKSISAISPIKDHTKPIQQKIINTTQKINVNKSPHITKFASQKAHAIKPKFINKLTIVESPADTDKIKVVSIKKLTPQQHNKRVVSTKKNHNINNSAKHTLHKSSIHPKIFIISGTILLFACISGYYSYQRIPQISIKVAAKKAGFSAQLPNRIPSGFALTNPIQSTKGNIVLNYISNSEDGKKFVISQKPSNWSSESLLNNVFKSSRVNYKTFQQNGLTIYVYGGNNATWIDKGIWYTITGHDVLSSDQLLALASSM